MEGHNILINFFKIIFSKLNFNYLEIYSSWTQVWEV